MSRADFFRKRDKRDKNGFAVAVMHLVAILFLLVVLIVSMVLTYGCEGPLFKGKGGEDGKGVLVLGFTREFGSAVTRAAGAMPDTNSFILSVKDSGGEVVYKGRYSDRPGEMTLEEGSYDVKVFSREFSQPEFDAPCYSDSATVMVESGKVVRLSFLCRLSNGAVRLGFSPEFRDRFAGYVAVLEGSGGSVDYPYTESRFLYMNAGDVFIKMRSTQSSDDFLIARKHLEQKEMVTVNLHSSVTGDPPGEDPPGSSNFYTGILVDTASVWFSEDVDVGERRDGSSRELALSVDEIAVFEGAKGVWVSGYVAGYLTTASLISEAPFNIETNIAISSLQGEQNRELCAGISLPAGEIRSALNLKGNPGVMGQKIWVKGTITGSYFGLPGVNNVTAYAVE